MVSLKFPLENLLAIEDPRDLPTYSIPLAAHYLRIPVATLRTWVRGRTYPVRGESARRFFKPLIQLPNEAPLLSFYNLAEAHVLSLFRREHKIEMAAIRKALDYVSDLFHWKRPLIEQAFQTDGVALFVEHLGHLIDASGEGQRVMRECVEQYLQRLEWEHNVVAKLYPFTRMLTYNSPKMILIDPRFSFGRPFLEKTRVATAVIAERYKAGDSIEHLSYDYACEPKEIEEAIRCELNISLAA